MTSLTQKRKLKKSKEDKLNEECGIFGVSNHEDASALVALRVALLST